MKAIIVLFPLFFIGCPEDQSSQDSTNTDSKECILIEKAKNCFIDSSSSIAERKCETILTFIGLIGTTHEGVVDKLINGEITHEDTYNYIKDDLSQNERRIMTENFVREYEGKQILEQKGGVSLEVIIRMKKHHNCPFETF